MTTELQNIKEKQNKLQIPLNNLFFIHIKLKLVLLKH